ncbi:MAG: superoxide dismutase, Ni [Neptuniibacter caesariensis]|uniref:Superoxide dismutase, Ni n=1 Tax=Neptuniibacter caesariensis TaxID=207954 RepID=A0A2G6JP05_NEPCE|nr:MAG: superoxide dismutase, Ni [Neptuniibacter caesariensis]
MLHKLASILDKKMAFTTASAHCDIPCKIYDPITAQISALTVIRMVDLISELDTGEALTLAQQAQLSRLVAEKEKHALQVKEEVRVIWGDYFKQPQFDQIPNVHELVHNIMLQGSKAKQHIDRDMALGLLDLVNQFAEAFWKTKGVEVYTATCPYPPEQTVVYPKLG